MTNDRLWLKCRQCKAEHPLAVLSLDPERAGIFNMEQMQRLTSFVNRHMKCVNLDGGRFPDRMFDISTEQGE